MMNIIGKLLGTSPFAALVEHTKKVHACVALIKPLADAVLGEDYEAINTLHHEMSRLEYEADQIKNSIRHHLTERFLLPVSQNDVRKYLACQDDVADAAEDFAVVLRLRRTKIHADLQADFVAFVDKVVETGDCLLTLAEELTALAETGFSGAEANHVLARVETLSLLEFEADKIQRRFAEHYYAIEDQLDPVTIMMYDKYCRTLSKVANKAEGTAKYLRNMIEAR